MEQNNHSKRGRVALMERCVLKFKHAVEFYNCEKFVNIWLKLVSLTLFFFFLIVTIIV